MAGRPILHTSHPLSYGPPPVLEPPANLDPQQQQQQLLQQQQQQLQLQQQQQQHLQSPQRLGGSASSSPHMSAVHHWPSPSHADVTVTSQSQVAAPDTYGYHEQYGASTLVGTPLYYPNSNMRRPQNADTGLEGGYDLKTRAVGEVWTTSVS